VPLTNFRGAKPQFLPIFRPKIDTLSPAILYCRENQEIWNRSVSMWARPYQTWWGPPPTSEIDCPLGVWGGTSKLWINITSAVWQLATRCLILGVGFGVKLSNEDILKIQSLRDIAMATNFETILAANGLWWEMITWGFRIKDGLFSVNPYVCWSLSLDSYLRQSELLQAGDCQVNCQHTSYIFCTALVNISFKTA